MNRTMKLEDLGEEPIRFQNVLLQTAGGFGIKSILCKELSIERGSYAQYKVAAAVTYLEKGKRTRYRIHVYGDSAFLLVVPNVQKAPPAPALVEGPKSASGMSCSMTRYASFDDRYRTDHIAQLDAAGIVPLVYIDARADREETPAEPVKVAVVVEMVAGGVVQREVAMEDLSTVAVFGAPVSSMSVRRELRGLPTLAGFCGPMWDGDGRVRYETQEVNDLMAL